MIFFFCSFIFWPSSPRFLEKQHQPAIFLLGLNHTACNKRSCILLEKATDIQIFERFTDDIVRIADERVGVKRHRLTLIELNHGGKVNVISGSVSSQRQWHNFATNVVELEAFRFYTLPSFEARFRWASIRRLSLWPRPLSVVHASSGRTKGSIS